MTTRSDPNPDALPGAPEPTLQRIEVDGASIHTEIRGSGNAVLLIGAADEDAETYRGIAERLTEGHTVVSYDRRGTGRSDRDNWPADSTRHADDAAALLMSLGLGNVTVLGASAGGIVALRLALRHPELLRTVLAFEPGILSMSEEGDRLRRSVESAVDSHLRSHPGDWQGATEALGRAAASSVEDLSSLFTPPPGKEWFVRRTATNAESLILGDIPLTRENFDPDAVASCPVTLRFSHGTTSLPVFRDICRSLAALRGDEPDTLEGAGHSIFYHPVQATEYVTAWS